MSASGPEVSIIVPTHEDADVISRCLDSIQNQTYDAIQTIVVDDLSADETVEICKEYPVQIIEEETGMSEARCVGFEQATAEFVYHVDADMELSPGVVEECVEYSVEYGCDALLVPERNVGDSFWARANRFGKEIHRRESDGNLRFLRSELYEGVGRHNPDRLSGEDWDLHKRVVQDTDANIGHIDSIVYHHLGEMSFTDILQKKQRYAASQRSLSPTERRELDAVGNVRRNLRHADLFLRDFIHAFGYILIHICNAILVRYYRYAGR